MLCDAGRVVNRGFIRAFCSAFCGQKQSYENGEVEIGGCKTKTMRLSCKGQES